jgi:colanic acid biosynthesis protein WcaH
MNNGRIPQTEYNRIITKVPIVCIDVIIYYQGKMLFIKRADEPARGEWWLPGGRLYKGESLQECALRKAREETGLECRFIEIVHFDNTIFDTGPNNIPVHSVNFCALLIAETDQVKPDESCLDYVWADGPYPYITNSYVEKCLLKANSRSYYLDD